MSRVLNDQPRVAASTRDRVLKVADALGYQPHTFAQSLARRTSNLISVVVPAMSSYFFLEVLRGVQDSLSESGFDLIVHLAKTPKDAEAQFDSAHRRGRSAGVLIVSPTVLGGLGERLARARQPVVLIDCVRDGFDSVSVDNVRGGFLATEHLIESGCRRIALVMADPSAVPAANRRDGFREALLAHDLPFDESLVVVSRGDEDGFTEVGGYEATKELFGRGVRPDGVFATSDVQALGVLRAAREYGVDVPGDMKLVGFDNIPLLGYAGITTMSQPMYQLGAIAAARLLERLDDPQLPSVQTVRAPDLVVRSSSGAVATTEVSS